MRPKVVVIIPALNEEAAIGKVVGDIPKRSVDEIVVVDNGSTDRTADTARRLGVTVLEETERGYGSACLAGIRFVSKKYWDGSTIIVFLDGDYSDHPEEMDRLLRPLKKYSYDMVVGTRTGEGVDRNAMGAHVRIGNFLLCKLLSFVLRKRITDLGPFRAMRLEVLKGLDMQERTYGWTIEMTVKAVHKGLRVKDVPVSYRKRIGRAKISGGLGSAARAIIVMLCAGMRYHLSS